MKEDEVTGLQCGSRTARDGAFAPSPPPLTVVLSACLLHIPGEVASYGRFVGSGFSSKRKEKKEMREEPNKASYIMT